MDQDDLRNENFVEEISGFSQLPVHNLKKYDQIFIFGYTERGKLLEKYLSNEGIKSISFVDNYYDKINDNYKSSDFEISSFDNLNLCIMHVSY